MASKTKNKSSVSVVMRKAKNTNGKYDGIERYIPYRYLSKRDEERGLDSWYDLQGFKVVSL